ncbi:MAG: sensor histidine kinase [Coriobacteriia bacterium]
MKRRTSIALQVFVSVLAVALGSALVVWLTSRMALSAAFDDYLSTSAGAGGRGMGGNGMGRMMLGAAENTFLSRVDTAVVLGALGAVIAAAVVAFLLARHISRPVARLQAAAEGVARGDLTQRSEVSGPSEIAALGSAFNRMAANLQEAEKLRQRMVSDVSHELRNPIAAARAQAEGMADGILAVDPARLNSLVEDLQHLSALVEDLRELASAESGHLHYAMHELDLTELVRRETSRAAATAPSGTRVVFQMPDAPISVCGDEVRLSEVMRNLLSNAVRHTPSGTVTASVSRRVDGSAEVRVTDTGEGIAAEDLPYVFERFYRADAARASHTGGAGLGLAITKRIIEDHGGEVFAESVPGQTAVGFRLARNTH